MQNAMKFKLRPINIAFVVYVFFMAILTPVLFFPAVFIYLFAGTKHSDVYIQRAGAMYARHLFWVFGVKVKVSGIENLPQTNNLCFVSNHQSAADIPLIVGFIPKKVGFIAKKELGRIPMLNVWMKALGCILIDRKDIRQSLKVIDKGIAQIEKGHPLVVFPEGTRSRGPKIGKFKPGAFKLLSGTGTLAVPLTISGTYKVMEERGIITPTHVQLTIHPAIDVDQLTNEERKALPERIYEVVKPAV